MVPDVRTPAQGTEDSTLPEEEVITKPPVHPVVVTFSVKPSIHEP
jgi:hypothetical protein